MWRHPHGATENFGGLGRVSRDVEETMLNAPAAAEGEGHAIARQRDFRTVRINPVVVWILCESLLYRVYCAVDVGFCHAIYLDRHCGVVKR